MNTTNSSDFVPNPVNMHNPFIKWIVIGACIGICCLIIMLHMFLKGGLCQLCPCCCKNNEEDLDEEINLLYSQPAEPEE
jgi:hypothetical protein